MSKHTPYTPGPWVAVGFWVEHPDDKRGDICTCAPEALGQGHLQRTDAEVVANARMIASAPDLLAALKVMLRDVEAVSADGQVGLELEPSIYQAHAAIAKAMGGEA